MFSAIRSTIKNLWHFTSPVRSGQHRSAMSADVVDYLHIWPLSIVMGHKAWDRWPSRVEAAIMRIIDIFDRQAARGTFLMFGCVAKHAPLGDFHWELMDQVYGLEIQASATETSMAR